MIDSDVVLVDRERLLRSCSEYPTEDIPGVNRLGINRFSAESRRRSRAWAHFHFS